MTALDIPRITGNLDHGTRTLNAAGGSLPACLADALFAVLDDCAHLVQHATSELCYLCASHDAATRGDMGLCPDHTGQVIAGLHTVVTAAAGVVRSCTTHLPAHVAALTRVLTRAVMDARATDLTAADGPRGYGGWGEDAYAWPADPADVQITRAANLTTGDLILVSLDGWAVITAIRPIPEPFGWHGIPDRIQLHLAGVPVPLETGPATLVARRLPAPGEPAATVTRLPAAAPCPGLD